jgi:hypothetical protein
MKGAYLGPAFSNEEIERYLKAQGAPYVRLCDTDLLDRLSDELAGGKVIGWFQGRMEFGPRALGGRSIIGDARSTKMQSVMNLKIKYRESFRPFAPSVLRERVADYFDMDCDSPYMLLVAPVREGRRTPVPAESQNLWGIDLLNVPKSDIPAVTHIDYSARIQTVHEATNPRYYGLLKAFEAKTGCGVIVNTSFNVRGGPSWLAGRRLPLLHAHRDGLARSEVRARRRSEAAGRRHRLAQRVRAGLRVKERMAHADTRGRLRNFGPVGGFRRSGSAHGMAHQSPRLWRDATVILVLPRWWRHESGARRVYEAGRGAGLINTRILLGLVFFAVVTPIGLVMRLLGRDPVRRRLEPSTESYRMRCVPRPGTHVATVLRRAAMGVRAEMLAFMKGGRSSSCRSCSSSCCSASSLC